MTATKEQFLTLKKSELVTQAHEMGVGLLEGDNKEVIAEKIEKHLSVLPAPEKKEKKEKLMIVAKDEEIKAFIQELADLGFATEQDGDVITFKKGGRETCVNIDAPLVNLKRALQRFLQMELPVVQ